jgi:hypothetical protein
MSCRLTFISMIFGMRGTTSQPPRGASTRELMGRLGHASMRAALIYQHRTMTRDRAIAEALDALIEQGQS